MRTVLILLLLAGCTTGKGMSLMSPSCDVTVNIDHKASKK